MIKALIGHRGTGKTQLLRRIKQYFTNDLCFDLDLEIQRRYDRTVFDIFHYESEDQFRKYEIETFSNLMRQHPNCWISLGAGFQIDKLTEEQRKNIEFIWIRRQTDSLGRIFSNRPTLDLSKTRISDFLDRFDKREKNYHQYCNWDYQIPEGLFSLNDHERQILENKINLSDATITISPKSIESFRYSQTKYIELRDDLLSNADITKALHQFENEKILLSFRSLKELNNYDENFINYTKALTTDFAIELNQLDHPLYQKANIISLHQRQDNESVVDCTKRLERMAKKSQHLKLAIHIHNFSELQVGYLWQQKDPANRSFLPRSNSGRWSWFRLFMKGRQKLNFVKSENGSAVDQPSIYEWISKTSANNGFAAVLGSPVFHSQSPEKHREFFSKMNMPFYAIDMAEQEWPEAIVILKQLGLKMAAVTSPLKKVAGNGNTLLLKENNFITYNTDPDGFSEYKKYFKENEKISVWGGGGTLAMLKAAIPKAQFFSSRTTDFESSKSPDILIWAAAPNAPVPSNLWRPRLVIDLNYREDSFAKEFALNQNAEYVNGQQMFDRQASEQQKIWSNYERK